MAISPPQPTLDYCMSIRALHEKQVNTKIQQIQAGINAENRRLLSERESIVSNIVKSIFHSCCCRINFSKPEEQQLSGRFCIMEKEYNYKYEYFYHPSITEEFSNVIAKDSVYRAYKGEIELRDNVKTELTTISQLVIQRLNQLMIELAKECSVIGLSLKHDFEEDYLKINFSIELLTKKPKNQGEGIVSGIKNFFYTIAYSRASLIPIH